MEIKQNKQKKAMLNTTITEDVLIEFREYCKTINCPMNMAIETFMKQFSRGEFSFKLTKNNMTLDIEE